MRQLRFQPYTWFLIVFTLGLLVGHLAGSMEAHDRGVCTFCELPVDDSREPVAAHLECMGRFEKPVVVQVPVFRDPMYGIADHRY